MQAAHRKVLDSLTTEAKSAFPDGWLHLSTRNLWLNPTFLRSVVIQRGIQKNDEYYSFPYFAAVGYASVAME